MLNTFLTDTNFSISAQNLDRPRNGKQRIEAYQVLSLIWKINYLSKIFQSPKPTDSYLLYDWLRNLVKTYKNSNIIVYEHGDDNFSHKLSISSPDIDLHKKIKLEEKKYTDANNRSLKLGFAFHPSIIAWLNYEDALKEYIDIHIEEWIKRGYENNMKRYTIRGAPRPPWTYDFDFIRRHRSMLLQKEIQRNEPAWYIKKPQFVSAGQSLIYFWPYTPKCSAGVSDKDQKYKKNFVLEIIG